MGGLSSPLGSGNPILDEIMAAHSTLSPAAQKAVGMAGAGMASAASVPLAKPMGGQPLLGGVHGQPLEPGPVSLPSGPMPSMPSSGGLKVNAPLGTVEGDQAKRSGLMGSTPGLESVYGKIAHSGFGQEHPLAGKILGGLAQVPATAADIGLTQIPSVGAMVPGTSLNHAMQVRGAGKALTQDEENREKEAQSGALNAEVPLRQAETDRARQQVANNEPVEITPEQATALGMPELTGEKVSPVVLAGLSRTHQTNTTKESTTSDTNQTREKVAATGAGARESVAATQATSREKIASETADMRKALESMREASGLSKNGKEGQPTSTTRTMSEMAATVIPRMHAVKGEVDKLAGELGPAVGRWNDLMVNKGGKDYPEFAGLDTDLDLLASAIVRTHFGARGGQEYRKELRKQFGEAQSPEDLKARIDAAEKWIQGYADAGQTKPANLQDATEPKVMKFNPASGRLE